MSATTISLVLEGASCVMLGVIIVGIVASLRPFRKRSYPLNIHEKLDRLIRAKKIRDEIRQQMRCDSVPAKPKRRALDEMLNPRSKR